LPPTIRDTLAGQQQSIIAPLSPAIANCILTLCFRTLNYQLGLEYVDEIPATRGFEPNIELFNSLIQLKLKVSPKSSEHRNELGNDAIAVIKTIRARNLGPNLDTYRRMLYACTLLDSP